MMGAKLSHTIGSRWYTWVASVELVRHTMAIYASHTLSVCMPLQILPLLAFM